ncbi:MAG: hypothetical protein HUK08_00055 [Bacteroidaceae bacterium]|nr:hypothetical protein [Bacteroidaceae bacterium]
MEEHTNIKDVIRSQAREDERPNSSNLSLKMILAGDFINAEGLKRHMFFILLIVVFVIVYVAMRYSVQQDLIKIDKLKVELVNAKYRSLAASSQLTEMCRESNVQRLMKEGPDSAIHPSSQPPYVVQIPEEE